MIFGSLHWFDFKSLIAIFFSVISNILIIRFWNYERLINFGLKRYKGTQRIHTKETPRMGGLIIFLSVLFYLFLSDKTESVQLIYLILVSFIPSFVFALKEDIYHNVSPLVRFLSLILGGILLVVQYKGQWPTIEIPYLSILLNHPLGILIFYPLAIAGISNGFNLIDGVNGLCASAALAILGCLLFLAHQEKDAMLLVTIFILMSLIFIFLLFNYPLGRIFLGDLGAYYLGFSLASLVIFSYARHPYLPTTGAILILIYPATEVIFSYLRRILAGMSPYKPDTEHLHNKLFFLFRPNPYFKKISNALVMPVMFCIWIFPLIIFPWVYEKPIFIIISIVLFLIFYTYVYFKIPKKIK